MEYDNTNRGAAFVNSKKKTEKHPDHTGSINVDGVEYWLSMWNSKSKQGKNYFSVSVTKKEAVQETVDNDINDEIPF